MRNTFLNRPAPTDLELAVSCLKLGGIIAYPTEAVFGLGCDPARLDVVEQLLRIKNRDSNKGLILVAADWSQLEPYIEPIPPKCLTKIQQTWPGPYTWVFPVRSWVPKQLCGEFSSIAVRVSAHPSVQALCQEFGSAIISTSANISGHPPARDAGAVNMIFGGKIDFILPGEVGSLTRPTEIRDAITGEVLRA